MELTRLPRIKVNNNNATTGALGAAAPSTSSALEELEAPIMGYEIREPSTRHTVYKIYVHYADNRGWFVYRRYREFHKLRCDLRKIFPFKEFILPPKRFFGDNFEPRFLNKRRQGLQGFLYMITRQRDVQRSPPVTAFLMLDNPPSMNDDLAQCQCVVDQLEATVEKVRGEKTELISILTSSESQIVELHDQKHAVLAALRYERQLNGRKFYPGDDLSLMFEYRSLPEVCRVDVSSFLIRKPPIYLARKQGEEKTRKPEERTRKVSEKSRKDELLRDREYMSRSRPHTPPRPDNNRSDVTSKDRHRLPITKSPISSPMPQRKRDAVKGLGNGEFQSMYDLHIRRKSMPGAVELHRVSNMAAKAAKDHVTDTARTHNILLVPGTRPRSYSATPSISVDRDTLQAPRVAPWDRIRKQASLECPKSNMVWSSMKDLRKMKSK